jgi:hypothetical protein
MQTYYKKFAITGVINVTTEDTVGLESTDQESRRCLSVLLNVSGYAGNHVKIFLERETLAEIYDYLISTDAATGTNQYQSINKLIEFPLDVLIPKGDKLIVAIVCGGTAKNVQGAYKYVIEK